MKSIDDALRAIIASGDIPGLDAFARRLPGFNPKTDCGFCALPMLTAQHASTLLFRRLHAPLRAALQRPGFL